MAKFVPLSFLLPLAPLWMVFVLTITAPTSASVPNSIRLHDQAAVNAKSIRLGDVAELIGQDAEAMHDVVLATFDSDQRNVTITLDQVRQILDAQGANWGKVTLGGYAACVVYERVPDPEPLTAAASPLVTNPHEEIELDSAVTLRQRVIDLIERFTEVDEDELGITFNEKDAKILAQSAWQDRYEIQPMSPATLGRVPFVIRQYRDGRLYRTDRIMADITRRYMAVVAKRTVGRDQTFAPGDVAIEEVYLDTRADQLATDLSQVVGFVAASVVRRDSVIHRQQVRSPTLVRRGEVITVRCISGDLVVKTVGRAAEDGILDQLIQVRNDRTREVYFVRVTGPRIGMVNTLETSELTGTTPFDDGNNHP